MNCNDAFRIAVFPGDGIATEIDPRAVIEVL